MDFEILPNLIFRQMYFFEYQVLFNEVHLLIFSLSLRPDSLFCADTLYVKIMTVLSI